ncbi:MAG: hypothetical protein CM15mP42_09040 [Methanobacteriota archaeon]|nr:MAG: hypothetical protein CM15mP42_09040 [Euryarchaeota archaeon]
MKKPFFALLVGLSLFFLPLSSSSISVWFGLRETGFHAVDYFPLNPWLGLFFVSMALAKYIYPEGKSLTKFEWPEQWLWLGRKHFDDIRIPSTISYRHNASNWNYWF